MTQTRYRGAQTSPLVVQQDMNDLFGLKPNLIRYQYMLDLFDEAMAQLDALIRITPIPLVLNAVNRGGSNPVGNPADKKVFLDKWQILAEKYKDNAKILAYGILNEPNGTETRTNILMQDSYNLLRGIAPKKKIIITCAYSDPAKFSKTLFIPNDDNVWYEVHMYLPISLTHQGIMGRRYPIAYNGNIKGLKSKLARVRNFQLDHHAHMYVGEFGISSYADENSRATWLRDCISIFEEYGWNWTYHAWREAPVWNLEPTVIDVMINAWWKNA